MKIQLRLLVSVLFCLMSFGAFSQTNYYKGEIFVTTTNLEQQNDSLLVTIDFILKDVTVLPKHSLDFIPLLVTCSDTLQMQKFSVLGRQDYAAFLRDEIALDKAYTIKGFKKVNTVFSYRVTLPFAKWMREAHLNILTNACICDDQAIKLIASHVTLQKPQDIPVYVIEPALAFLTPETEEIKQREVSMQAYLDFAVGKSALDENMGNNAAELAKIVKMIADVETDQAITVKNIDICGYASPEGSIGLNKTLSQNRANTLKNYLINKYPEIGRKKFSIHSHGEDWESLSTAVEASNLTDKADILAIINDSSVADREKPLRAYNKGTAWAMLLKDYFPSLRRSVVKIDYSVRDFDLEEAKEVIKTKPQNLSLNEMFLVANTFEKDSPEFIDAFKTAVRYFPKDATANINAAMAALADHDVETARKHLEAVKVKTRIPELDNCLGLLEAYEGNYDKAEEYLRAAEAAGLKAATENLKELSKKRENAAQILEQEKYR